MWNYLLKTFVNVCGKRYRKQMKFQYMENKLTEMEKQRMDMFLENEDEEQDTYFDLIELKEHLKTLPPNERHKLKDFERLTNLANGQDPSEGMSEIDMVIKGLEEEERENKNQPEPEDWTSTQKLGNRLTRRPATVVNFFQPCWSWNAQNPVCFSHFSSLGGIFKASFCTAWANSKFRKCVFVEAKLSFYFHFGQKVWNSTFEVTISMFCQSHVGQQCMFQLFHTHFDYPCLNPNLSVWLSIYISKDANVSMLCKVCARYTKRKQKKSMWNHSNICRQHNTNHMLA